MENSIEISSIPILHNANYGEWSARIVILLRSKDLLQVCENSLPTDATTPVTNKWNKANSEAISIISSRVSHRVFIEVVKKYSTNAQQLWTKLEEQYASKKAINRGRVWMQWLRSSYDGNLQNYIDNSRILMMLLETVNINIPAECHSFTLLGKLSGDPKIHQFVEVLSLNEELIQQPELVLERLQELHDNSKTQLSNQAPAPTALVSESAHPYKITYYCTNGKHNPMCTTHTKESCFAENPHLRPPYRSNKRKNRPYQSPTAHLSTAQVLMTGKGIEILPQELIIDCGATHHMFNSRSLFSSFAETSPIGVCTGDSSSSLLSKGSGTVDILINNQVFSLKDCLLSDEKFEIKGKIVNNLMRVEYTLPAVLATGIVTEPWHQRLGHPGNQIIKSMELPTQSAPCSICDLNKIHKKSFNHQFERANKPLNCVHIDLVGPISPSSLSGNRYFLTVVDQSTSFKIVRLLKHKSEALKQFVIVKNYMENLHNRSLKKLVSDRGGEFLNNDFKLLAETQGFVHVFSPPDTPQHNGYAERVNRTILEKTRCLLNNSGLPKHYWAESLNTAVFLSNLIPTPSRFNLSPYSLLAGNPPRIKKLRVFGCSAIVSIPRNHREWKLSPAGEAGVLLGYENNNSAYRILRLCDKKVLISKHVRFNESDFPFSKSSSQSDGFRATRDGEVIDLESGNKDLPAVAAKVVDETHIAEVDQAEAVDEIYSADIGHTSEDNSRRVDEIPLSSEPDAEPCEVIANSRPTQLRVIGPRHPTIISGDINQDNILTYSRRPKALVTRSENVPKTFRSALKSPSSDEWLKAIKKELTSMIDLNVWDVVELKPDYKLVGTTWTPGVDFGKTYAPTGRLNSLRCLILHSVSNGLEFHQVDIKSGFLNAPLVDTVFLSIPQGLEVDMRKFCLRLKKAIYGLKQAPLAWYDRLRGWLCQVGFSSCVLDPCVFFWEGDHPVWLYVHVDDIAIFGKNVSIFKEELKYELEIKDIGPADLMLGIKVTHSSGRVSLNQGHFIESLLELYGMDSCKPVATPLLPNTHLVPATKQEIAKFDTLGVNYQSAIGSINYLSTGTRPDLSYAVSSLSQFLEKPGFLHWQAFLHVVRYLRGTLDVGLVYSGGCLAGVEAYSDADWGNCPETRRSITGYLATFGKNLVLWKTRKQPSVSISTMEAEYKALCDLVSELLWLKQWCHECNLLDGSSTIPIHEDNQGFINTINGDCNVNNNRFFDKIRCSTLSSPLSPCSRGDVENPDQNQFDRQSATPILTERLSRLP
ncbi:hypothetical protein O181_041972 [Austropuccinia psidii MF-1]|uniref:Integrase catalytic domain-containing protein n=1 Tax=Austropuccinia psidii MF-1 TaxID=1389203 RepID=A0A9Q3HFE0_9BASI|nr:hypothetical protein [Austropuccinia psidii MF-1]